MTMSTRPIATWPAPERTPIRPALGPLLHHGTALPIALAIWTLATVGDLLTTAEAVFTLLYLLPIGIAVWWRGCRAGLVFTALATASSIAADVTGHAPRHTTYEFFVLGWNMMGQLGVFVAFAILVDKLRKRFDVEVRERVSAVEQLRHADRLNTVGKLASGIAHELGTPLNVVHGRASMIASERMKGPDAIECARIIVRQADRMTTIIQNLLAFARRGGSRRTSLDLSRLVRETGTLLAPLAKKQHVELSVVDGKPHTAPVNAGEVQQVLTNLIINAVQAMPGGGKVSVELGQRHFDRGAQPDLPAGDYAEIHVRDEGTGIAPEILPNVFDPFFTTKEVGAGTGLGLSVAFGIVRDHGGTIDVRTAVGKGTDFIVYLPQAQDAGVHEGEAPAAAAKLSMMPTQPPAS